MAMMNNQWMCLCNKKNANGKKCGWNPTHTTNFHGKWMNAPSTFSAALGPLHPFNKFNPNSGGGGATAAVSQVTPSNDGGSA